jgi:hypothetical protein
MHRHEPEDRRIDPAAIEVRAVQEKRMEPSQQQREKNTSGPPVKESVNLHLFSLRERHSGEKQLTAPSLRIVWSEDTNAWANRLTQSLNEVPIS